MICWTTTMVAVNFVIIYSGNFNKVISIHCQGRIQKMSLEWPTIQITPLLFTSFNFPSTPPHFPVQSPGTTAPERTCRLGPYMPVPKKPILSRLDYGSATLVGVPARLIDRLQTILHAAARLVNGSRKYDHLSSLLRDLHWLRVPERIMYRLAVLVFRCRNHTAPEYLTRNLQWVADDDSRRRLRSATTHQLMVPCLLYTSPSPRD